MRTIPQLMKMIHENAVAHGFYEEQNPKAYTETELNHIIYEVTEALAEIGKGNALDRRYYSDDPLDQTPHGFPVELADIVIIAFGIAEVCGINLYGEIRSKMMFNESRPYKHGKEF